MILELTCNTPDEALFANIRENSERKGWLRQAEAHEGHAVIVGGGPSLAENLPQIERRRSLGQTVFALNGACGFVNRHGIIPDYQVILDARPENAGLVGEAGGYLFASQVDPQLFDLAPVEPVLWHQALDGIDDHLPAHDEDYFMIGGGPSVGLSAMNLVFGMGYRRLHLFGFDCSHREGQGHAYKQSADPLCKYTLGGKTFTTTLTMARQAERFPEVANALIDQGCIITVDADGLILAVLDEMRAHQKEDT